MSIKVELSGGIGNQLFQYSAGIFLQEISSIQVDFIIPINESRKVKNLSSLREFKFKGRFLVESKKQNWNKMSFTRFNRFVLRNSNYYRLFMKKVKLIYQSPEIGFDSEFALIRDELRIVGYFQTHLYASEIKENLVAEFKLHHQSESYIELEKEILRITPIVIHIRRGDYLKHKNSIGLLSYEYFFKAIQEARKLNPSAELWVFSDDEVSCERILGKLPFEFKKRIYPSMSISPEEALKLMSFGTGIILSNSTYSWWAAYLSESANFVIAPAKWLRNLDDPKHLIPNEWILIESSWDLN
jgi:hypothetical protein